MTVDTIEIEGVSVFDRAFIFCIILKREKSLCWNKWRKNNTFADELHTELLSQRMHNDAGAQIDFVYQSLYSYSVCFIWTHKFPIQILSCLLVHLSAVLCFCNSFDLRSIWLYHDQGSEFKYFEIFDGLTYSNQIYQFDFPQLKSRTQRIIPRMLCHYIAIYRSNFFSIPRNTLELFK